VANKKIDSIEGIGPVFAEKLRKAGINDTDTLLERCCEPTGRKQTAEDTGIDRSRILKWTNMADLFRITGVGPEYAELLEAAGVDTVKELRHRKAENLAEKMSEVNAEKKLTRRVPDASAVQKWVDEAKDLPPVVTH
jgi:predicted flap endonuclease-1-like 5' DNA nuclease